MAIRTPLSVCQIIRAGVQVIFTPSDQANGCSIPNDGGLSVLVQNGNLTPQTVTFSVARVVDGDLTVNPRVVVVPAGTTVAVGPFPVPVYTQQDGTLWIDCSAPMGLLALKH